MNKEAVIDLTGKLLEATSFAFSLSQRKALNERDTKYGMKIEGNKGMCQFPEPHKCNGDKMTNQHHIIPQRYSQKVGIDPDYCENALRVCRGVHVENEDKDKVIHPDTREALKRFRSGDKKAFEDMQVERDEKIDEKVIYWNNHWDRQMTIMAVKNTQKAKRRGWFFPEKNGRNGK